MRIIFGIIATLFAVSVSAQGTLIVTVPAGCVATPPTVTVTCNTPPPPTCPPGQIGTPPNCTTPPPAGACPGFPSTLTGTIPYGPTTNIYYSSHNGGFASDGAMVLSFTTPAKTSAKIGSITLAEYQGSPAARSGSLSMTPCDFAGGIGGYGVFANDTAPTVRFTLGVKGGVNIELKPSTTYYFNVHNPLGCGNPTCDVIVTLNPS